MFLIYSQETREGPSPEDIAEVKRNHYTVMSEAGRMGVLRAVDALKPTTTATTVRTQNGKTVVTDGPFAETKEQLAGYYIIDCRDLDEAIEWAARIPTQCKGMTGCIEIRPIHELEGRPPAPPPP